MNLYSPIGKCSIVTYAYHDRTLLRSQREYMRSPGTSHTWVNRLAARGDHPKTETTYETNVHGAKEALNLRMRRR
jgi:hypothetical protein